MLSCCVHIVFIVEIVCPVPHDMFIYLFFFLFGMQTGTLYQKLFDPDLRKTHKYTMFLNVVYKAMKIDDDGPRVLSYVKRLLQLCLSTTNASFTCGVLFLFSEVGKYKEQLKSHLQNLNIVKATSKEDQYDATKRDPSHAHVRRWGGKFKRRVECYEKAL